MVIVLAPQFVFAQAGIDSKSLDSYLGSRPHPFSGVVMISKNGDIAYEKAMGLADYELGVPNSSKTLFRVGSITKPFTALAILKLIADHKLSLDDRLCSFLKECPLGWEVINVRNLLSHTSGIPDLLDEVDYSHLDKVRNNIDQRLRTSNGLVLRFVPGTQFEYNNFGYILLGYIIEIASMRTYVDYLQEAILTPLGFNQTHYDDPVSIIENRADGYIRGGDGIKNLRDRTFPFAYSAGGLISTTHDFTNLERALTSNILLPDSLRQQMLNPGKDEYGFGLFIRTEFGTTSYEHAGLVDGFSSELIIFPNENLIVVALSNVENEDTSAIGCDLASLLLTGHPLTGVEVKVAKEKLATLQGTYRRPGARPVLVEIKNGVLTYKASREYVLMPIAEDEVQFVGNEEVHLLFRKDSQGRMEMVRTNCSSRDWIAVRDQ
jgi:CubicO group peptidase (beta-lactamase class C family)